VNGEFDKNDAEDMRKIIWILENATFCPLGKFAVMGLKDVIKYRLVEELNG
jgi:NADH:ubiquinone oxidoreductase subunit F (NADH-binding)